jgi:hypothetical protein
MIMIVRSVFLLTALALASLSGCVIEDPADTGEPVDSVSAASLAYLPMGFARVRADGFILEQFNSESAASAVVSHTAGTGYYTVSFPGLASGSNGHVQITAEGQGNQRCRSMGWFPNGTTQQMAVQCNLPSGVATDSGFAVLFYRYPQPAVLSDFAGSAYVWVTGGAAPIAPSLYNYNASGRLNTVLRHSAGNYTVTIPKGSAYNVSMMVTAYGGSTNTAPFCQIGYWGSFTDTSVNVRCWNSAGVAADSDFALSYATTGPTFDQQGAHAWFDGFSANTSYSAALGRIVGCSGVSVTGSRNGNLTNMRVQGDMGPFDASPFHIATFVNGYGSAPIYCKLEARTASSSGSSTTSMSTVRCYDGAGVETSPLFTFTEATSEAAGPC